ncbi:hypothetical protein [Shinella oryzae]|nr:hypothetical protein [Shinella oryzae]
MRTFLAVILVVLVIGAIAAIALMKGGSDNATQQPSPHAIDQGE